MPGPAPEEAWLLLRELATSRASARLRGYALSSYRPLMEAWMTEHPFFGVFLAKRSTSACMMTR